MSRLKRLLIIFMMSFVLIGCGSDSKNFVNTPFSYVNSVGMQYDEAYSALKEAGFKNIESQIEFTSDKELDKVVKHVSIGLNTYYGEGESVNKESDVTISYYKYDEILGGSSGSNDVKNTDTSEAPGAQISLKEASSEEEFLEMVKKAADLNIGEKDHLNDVALKDGVLTISVALNTDNDFGFTKEEFAEDRAASITDGILDIDDKWWDKLVLEFEGIGTVTKTKEGIIVNEYGMRYYESTYLDGSEHEEEKQVTNTEDNKAFVEKYSTEFIVGASLSLDRYIDGYKMSLAPQKWQIVKYDETDTLLGMTELSYKDIKYTYYFVGTLNMDSEGNVESTSPHFIAVGDNVLYNDGYCDELMEKLGN